MRVRNTLTLDPDVARKLEEEARRQGKPFKQVMNDALRRGLEPGGRSRDRPTLRYRDRPGEETAAPGIEPTTLAQIAEEIDKEAVMRAIRARRGPRPPLR